MKCTEYQQETREHWVRWRDGTPLNWAELKVIRKLRRNLRTRPVEGESERAWFERVKALVEPLRKTN